MASGIYVAMGAARNQEHRLDTLSNDLANANTPGFKSQETIYKQIHTDVTSLGNPEQAMGVHHPVRFLPEDRLHSVMVDRYTKFAQGSLKFTGNDLDLAIKGEGFFTLQGQNGPVYTRNGTFTLNREGLLVDQQGQPVLDDAGKSIQVNNAQGKIGISQDGAVMVDGERVAKLGLVRFDETSLQTLERIGNSGYRNLAPNVQPEQLDVPDVRQGFLETANVNPVHTMSMLIKTNRLFELNTRALQAYKSMDEQAAREVGKF